MRMTFCVFIAGRFVGFARILVMRRAGTFAWWSLIGRSFMAMAVTARGGPATSPSAWTTKPMMAAPSMRAAIAVRTEETWAASAFKAEVLEARSWLVNTSSSAIGCIHGTDEVPERD